MQKTPINRLALALAAFAVAGTTTSKAATYTVGDLLIGFVATGGTGSDKTLIANLGVTTTYRDQTTDSINFINIGTQLSNTFGGSWYDRTDLYMSLVGVRSSSNTSSSLVNGDPARTLYASQPRTAAGTEGTSNSSTPSITGDGAYTSVATAMLAVSNRFKGSATDSDLTNLVSQANTLDEFTTGATNPSVSYGAYQSRVDQAFTASTWGTIGLAGSVEAALDLYRNQARNDIAGQAGFGEPVGPGTFEGTFTINQAGQVSYLAAVPEPGSALMLGLAGIGSLLRRRRA